MSTVKVRFRKRLPGRGKPLPGFEDIDDKVRLGDEDNPEVVTDKTYDRASEPVPVQAWLTATKEKGMTVRFLWWSVTGVTGATTFGPPEGTDPELFELHGEFGAFGAEIRNLEFTILPGEAPVVATAWYILDDGSANGLTIDAFDGDKGEFVNDYFVTITPDADLTEVANETGFVPTKKLENILAYEKLYKAPDQVPFLEWSIDWSRFPDKPIFVNTAADSSGRTLTATEGSNGIAVAHYLTPLKAVPTEREVPSIWVNVSIGVAKDGGGRVVIGGKGFRIPPWEPPGPILSKDFATGLTLAAVAGLVKPELRGNVLEMAARQLSRAAESIPSDRAASRRFRALAALGSVVSASLGAVTLQLFQVAAPDARALIVVLGTAAAAAIGYLLPTFSRSFKRS